MIYLKYFESINNIVDICQRYSISNYIINQDGNIDVNGNVYLNNKNLTKLPVRFNYVSGSFYCNSNQLTSLIGAPKEVGGNFDCYNNQLTTLKGAPTEVDGYFYCGGNQLTTLKGAPTEVGGSFFCNHNQLPKEIYNNIKYIKDIIKWQDEYSIWNKDDTLNKYRFDEMMTDIINHH